MESGIFFHLFVIALVSLAVYKGCRLVNNIRQARKTGLQYVVVPFLETETVSQLATLPLRWAYTPYLDEGKGWPKWCCFMIKDWSWEDKRLAHDEFGDVFLVVSSAGIICYVADAEVSWDVLNRRYDFTKPRDKYKILEPYGPNVATAEGSTYRFHVRITAPPFSDGSGVNTLVWQETVRQTNLLLDSWATAPPTDLNEDINALTLAVISLAGFGRKLESVQDQAQEVPKGYKISFLHALDGTTKYMLQILVFPAWFLDWTPYSRASLAKRQLERYMSDMIGRERSALEERVNDGGKRTGPRGNLLKSVMQASHQNAQQSATAKTDITDRGFSDSEVMGNLWIYLLAGYETTANAIAYGLIVLALRPEFQQRLAQEIDRVDKEAAAEGRPELDYKNDFGKLEYCYGFMYETFRLYPGVTLITKMCKEAQHINVPIDQTTQTRRVILPPQCRVYLSAPGIHYHPKVWPSPNELIPERWMTQEASMPRGQAGKHVVAADRTRQMRGSLITFSDGSRACLGRKFAQAEYIAFLATLLRHFIVELAPGVDPKRAQRDLDLKCAGKITLAPLDLFRLTLRKRTRQADSAAH